MNSPLLGLTSGVSSPASPPAGTVETESGAAASFGELLLKMTGANDEALAEADTALGQAAGDAGKAAETPADLLAALVANLTGTDDADDSDGLTESDADSDSESDASTEDDSRISDVAADAAAIAALAVAPASVPVAATVAAEAGTGDAAALPVGGKSLPTPWLLLNQQAGANANAAANANAETATADTSAGGATEPVEAWSQLFEVASKSVEFKATAEAAAPISRQASAEPLLAINTLAGPLTGTSASARGSSPDAIAGIPVRSANFATLVGNDVLWQAKIGSNQAEIRLDPPELGPIDVRISRSDNETHLHFTVSHQATRDQLEQALPRLRELFGQGGLQLGQVEVEQGRREQLAQQPRDSNPGLGKRGSDAGSTDEVLIQRSTLMGLIDDYA
ncbi:flagellar hook-length control protein FliK [Permianibacter sp. IMCC34836]|uniref:flagellar hook-length control protein FliK n=1 Tax=Permianibacter fluminis TaxID=2738515 RepID=UPI001557878F|nr:flagellar hook-length control protein FliK [Permianibacter fluminis]NQD38031.1 flagellar hook-length control protein FliK [Permianibacter fluminis]